jgi:hypothetical protein
MVSDPFLVFGLLLILFLHSKVNVRCDYCNLTFTFLERNLISACAGRKSHFADAGVVEVATNPFGESTACLYQRLS